MQNLLVVALCTITVILVQSCYYDNAVDLYPNGCITVGQSYEMNIEPILERECVTCHNDFSQQGGVNLIGYGNVIEYVASGVLLGTIRHDEGFVPMPGNGGKISSCDISKIESWIEDGALDN